MTTTVKWKSSFGRNCEKTVTPGDSGIYGEKITRAGSWKPLLQISEDDLALYVSTEPHSIASKNIPRFELVEGAHPTEHGGLTNGEKRKSISDFHLLREHGPSKGLLFLPYRKTPIKIDYKPTPVSERHPIYSRKK